MKKVDLSKHPFNLDAIQLKWVETTISEMTVDEKIGQLFFPMGFSAKQKDLEEIINKYHVGGMMYRTSSIKKVQKAHRFIQQTSKIPLFLAANLEAGGNGIIDEGTNFGQNMEIGATNDPMQAYVLGELCAKEGKMVGCNMAFAPVIDINYNFRNPVTNTRAFSDRPELVAKMASQYVRAALDNNMAVTIKHFPGDGVDGRDHHLVKSVNSLPIEDWRKTYGTIYRESIKVGARGLMVGHISLPSYFDHNDPNKDVPASLNFDLLNGLLRNELGYNGLTMTDATLMTGFGSQGRREDLVPRAIAAGCDMFLFNRNLEEEFGFMKNGYLNGIITEERLQQALMRILGLKASLNLPTKTIDELVPKEVDNELLLKNKKLRDELSNKAITLVRDTQNLLPLNPQKHKKVGVMYFGNKSMDEVLFGNLPGIKGLLLRIVMSFSKKKSHAQLLIDALKDKGFDAFEYKFDDILKLMKELDKPLKDWANQFDVVIILTKMQQASNQTSLQITYKALGLDAPWFIHEVPTMLLSVANPYQVYDFEMIETVINSYTPKETNYPIIVDKLMGNSKFKGVSPVSLIFDEKISINNPGGLYESK